VRRKGRPRKVRDAPGKKLFDKHNISDEESISASDHQGHGEDDTDDDADQPLINTIRPSASKLRSLKGSQQGTSGHKGAPGPSGKVLQLTLVKFIGHPQFQERTILSFHLPAY
jgi:cohesin complex subunit SA-1/2